MKLPLAIKALALATLACFSAPGQASCTFAPNAAADDYDVLSSGYQNWGVYEWDAGSSRWVKVSSGHHPFFETESLRPGDVPVPSDAFGGGGGGGGGGSVNPNGLDAQDVTGVACGTLPATVVTASPISFGGSLFTLIFRRGGGGGGAQRSISAAALPAPATAAPITCSDVPEVRSENAQHVAARYGMAPFPGQRGRTITIRWSTGTVETYRNSGSLITIWMKPVEGTCRDR